MLGRQYAHALSITLICIIHSLYFITQRCTHQRDTVIHGQLGCIATT